MPDWKALARQAVEPAKLQGPAEADVVEELADYLEDRFNDLREQGIAEGEAYQMVVRELKDRQILTAGLRESRRLAMPAPAPLGSLPISNGRWSMFQNLGNDLRVALRSFRLRPGFNWMVVGMLALGIGGNATMFSIFNGLFLRPFPFPDAERLVDLDETAPKWNLTYTGISNTDFFAWQKDNKTFDGMAFSTDRGAAFVTPDGATMRVDGARVTHTMLDVLRLKPALGRNFLPEEDRPGGAKVVMLGYNLWQQQFAGDPNVLGRVVKLDSEPFTIIGVLPRDAVYPARADVWTPLAAAPDQGGSWYLRGIGRLKSGVAIEQASADLLRIHKGMIEGAKRKVNEITSPTVQPLRERLLGDFRRAANLLLGGVGILLLIACVNVAGLMMVRGQARAREIAIRTAMGAQRLVIVRQLLMESLMLALAGGALGVLLGKLALTPLLRLVPDVLPWMTFPFDFRIALFCAALTGASAIVFGLVPALQASRVPTRAFLQDGARSSWSRGRQITLNALIAGEVALAVLLLVGSAVLMQSFQNVMQVDPGFRADGVMSFRVFTPDARYAKPEQREAFFRTYLDKLRAIPGVQSVGGGSNLPVFEHSGWFAEVQGGWKPGPGEKNPVVLGIDITAGYLETMGVTLLEGRFFNDSDAENEGRQVAIINEAFAKQFWPNTSALGKGLRFGVTGERFIPVVGITRDMKHYGLEEPMRPSVMVPYRLRRGQSLGIVVRTAGDPSQVVAPAREILRQMDPELPMANIRSMSERLDRSLWLRRAYSTMFWVFAALSTILATAGIYGVISYAVAQRTREIGIRMALGAKPGQVMSAVLTRGLGLIACGTVIGLVASWFVEQVLDKLLFGSRIHNPVVYGSVFLAVLAVGALAGLIPARRAALINPTQTLRAE
jgi:predicted permease